MAEDAAECDDEVGSGVVGQVPREPRDVGEQLDPFEEDFLTLQRIDPKSCGRPDAPAGVPAHAARPQMMGRPLPNLSPAPSTSHSSLSESRR